MAYSHFFKKYKFLKLVFKNWVGKLFSVNFFLITFCFSHNTKQKSYIAIVHGNKYLAHLMLGLSEEGTYDSSDTAEHMKSL